MLLYCYYGYSGSVSENVTEMERRREYTVEVYTLLTVSKTM